MPCGCGGNCESSEVQSVPLKRGCCKTTTRDPLYVPEYNPPCCPVPRNPDPKHREFYCPSPPSRSEPLSHQEYLRKLKANNGIALSNSKTKNVIVGEGKYQTTIWTAAGDACSYRNDLVLPAVPPVRGQLYAQDSGMLTSQREAFAGRGTLSRFDKVNRTEGITLLRRKGLTIAGDDSFQAPAGGRRVCEVCHLIGTTEVDPTPCGICSSEATIVSPNDTLLIHFDANNSSSYSGSGSTWVNIGSGGTQYNATLLGSSLPTFDNGAIKSFIFSRNLLDSDSAYLDYNYMQFTRPNLMSSSFTWTAWIKTNQVGYGTEHYNLMYIVSTESGGVNNDFGFGINSNGKLAYGDGKLGGSDITINTTESVNTGTWKFVAVTRNRSTGEVKLYIDGGLDTTGNCNVANTLNTSPYVLIGSETDFTGYTFGGNIGEIRGNTTVLTDSEILNLYSSSQATYGV